MASKDDFQKRIDSTIRRYRPVFESGSSPRELAEIAARGGEDVILTVILLRAFFSMPLSDAKRMAYRARE